MHESHVANWRRRFLDEGLTMAAAATAEKSPDDPVAMWTLDELVDLGKVRGWLNRRHDPEFWTRFRDVCGLYLNPPDHAILLSIDEKPGSKQRNAAPKTNHPGPR